MNTLFPVFLKLDQINLLVVGGGPVGLEKLTAMLSNSPKANITLVAETILPEIHVFLADFPQVKVHQRKFDYTDLIGKHFVLLAANNKELHASIKSVASVYGILTNTADTPDLCDYYLGSIVQKGDLKVAISTNGKSPTLAKRLRGYLEASLPNTLQDVMDNLHILRKRMSGDFKTKVDELNALTAGLVAENK